MKEAIWQHTYAEVLKTVLPRVQTHGEAVQQAADAANAAAALVPNFDEVPAKAAAKKEK